MKNKSKKAILAEKVMGMFPEFTQEQVIRTANFLMSLSEVYYDNETKINLKNEAA